MPAPNKSKQPKKLDKSNKGEAPKKKKGSSSSLLIILSVVGVVVLLGVGITIFMLMSGGEKPPLSGPTGKQTANNQPQSGSSEEGTGTAQPDVAELTTKASELADSLADVAKAEEAGKKLRELLESDVVNKIQGGKNALLNAIKDKALAGNAGARQFIKALSKDSSNATLAQAALRIYEDSLKQAGEKDDAAMSTSVGEEPTNYLPNRVDVVFHMNLNKFLDSEYNKGLFATGAFKKEDIDKRIGMPANMIEQVVLGGIKDYNQVVGVIRTTSPYNWDDVKKTIQLSESGNTIKGKTYYIGKIDFMTEFLGQRIPGLDALKDKAAFWRVDVKTLVYADEVTMKDLLENPPTVEKNLDPPTTAALPGASGGNGAPPDGPTSGGISVGGLGGAEGGTNVSGGTGAPSALGGGASQKPNEGASAGSVNLPDSSRVERYRTLDGKMRRLIKYTEDTKIESLCLFADKATSKFPILVEYMFYLNRLPSVRNKEIDTLAVALPAVTGSPSLRVGVACKGRSVVREITNDIEKLLTSIAKDDLHDIFGFDFKLKQVAGFTEDQQASIGGGIGGQTGGTFGRSTLGGKGGMAPGPGGGAGAPGATSSSGGGNAQGITGGGFGTGLASEGNSPPTNLGQQGRPGAQQVSTATDTEPSGSLSIERSEEYIIITATVKSSLSDFTQKHMKGWMQQIRGKQEITSGKFKYGDLAASLNYLKDDLKNNKRPVVFPFGAHPRTFDAERGPRPYPAHERVSFFRELLPYLGDDRYFSMRESIDPERSWRTPSNLEMARIVVPHFLNPSAGTSSIYVNMHGIDQPLAATHFVGMAGVGPDAAYLPKSDPRAGIFGYDRQTSPDDVKDGLSNTIFMIEADKALLGPWLAGGGSTVRGTSLAGNDVGKRGGFSSPSYSGKQGVWVMMADGSTRFLSKDVSPEVFKALSTMNGGDSAGAIDLIASKVTFEVGPRSDAGTPTATTKKKRLVEEEEAPVKK
ncbi:MAG: DUF1559 domain-containing protein [Planctomycetia bacterium]|nr:DUF1559 domain-containing protein [Planctomycetia bacterium]